MTRQRTFLISCVAVLVACAGTEESQLLNRFFMACRSGDNATVASFSVVDFPAVCESWAVAEVGQLETVPFRAPELRRQLTEIRKQRDIQFEQGKYFLEDNYNAIEKIQIQLDKNPDYVFEGRLAEVKAEWDEIVQERKSLERDVQTINRELEREIKLAKMSLLSEAQIQDLDGEVSTKDVLVNITSANEEKPYTFTIRKYELTNTESGVDMASRWIIVDIREVIV